MHLSCLSEGTDQDQYCLVLTLIALMTKELEVGWEKGYSEPLERI